MTGGLAAQAALAAACLAAVVLLILGAARAARAVPSLRRAALMEGPVMLRGSLALDRGRRLHLVEAGGQQALVLTGASGDVIIHLQARP